MTRLQTELHRLFLLPDGASATPGAALPLASPAGAVRALVLDVARPAAWDALSAVWRGVQADLDLPAPAIAVNGVDGYQLWFSLAAPVTLAEGVAFLDGMRRRYLGALPADRIAMRPSADASSARHLPTVPAAQGETGNWSAFLAPDLAPLFADEPWLDLTPGDDAQADLLSRLDSTKPAAFRAALERLTAGPAVATDAGAARTDAASDQGATPPSPSTGCQPGTRPADPRAFLLDVMTDATVDLRLRIEAAKALLPSAGA